MTKNKKVIYLLVIAVMSVCNCKKDDKQGGIYGVITDKATGEPMRAAGVELFKGTNLLTKVVTGNDGDYEFKDLNSGEYILKVTVFGYRNIQYDVLVNSGKTSRADMQLEDTEIFGDDYVVLKSHGIMVQTQDLGTATWSVADNMCKSLRLAGSKDWRLPNIGELAVLYQNREMIGGFKKEKYWSSTSCNYHNCYDFNNGSTGCFNNSESLNVRAVRTLP